MTAIAPSVQAFFTERLTQRQSSPNTVAAYRDALRLLLCYLHETTGIEPSRLDFADLDANRIGAFLDHLEAVRHVCVTTRNARLAAIHSLLRFAALRHPEHAASIARVLAIPPKRTDETTVSYLTPTEVDALLATPDRTQARGRRDHAMLLLAVQTGLRVSELVGLRCRDVHLGVGAHVDTLGKGRKARSTPLTTATAAVIRVWLAERRGEPGDPLFPGPRGKPLGREAVRYLLAKHAADATFRCKSLANKKVTPHVLRHTCAMRLLESGTDSAVIALWLGHSNPQTTQIYIRAHLAIKERAIARTTPPNTTPGRFRPADKLLEFLENL
jgi:integrase/recombinase XerD